MNIDRNHIDDLFKEGLEDFSEVPRRRIWRQVSGKLLWREISHFNFSNVPALWTGLAATSLVVIALAILIPGYLSEEKPQQVSRTEQISPANPEFEPSLTEKKSDPQPKDQPASAGRSFEDGTTAAPESGKTDLQDTDATTAKISSPEKIIARDLTASQVSVPEPSAITGTKETFEQPRKETGNTVISQAEEEILTKPDINNPAETMAPPNASEQQINKIDAVEMEMVRSGIIGSDNINETAMTDQPEELPVSLSEDLLSGYTESDKTGSGKIQKMHSLSFSIGQFLKGKYRAPKRSYTESTMDMYRGTNAYFSASVYAAPEVTEYSRPASSSRESNYLIGAAAAYHTSRYMIQAGVEVSHFNDLGDYMVNMSTYDSVGYYHGVGGFVIDPDNPDSVIFQTHTVTVWDSVQHHSHQQTHNHYTYLQIPLLFGYKAMESGIFSAHIKAGPSFSFLLNKQEPDLNFSRPDATIQGIDNYTLPRLNASIQVLVSLSLQFQLTEQWGILAEPTYRYYVNPVYDVNGQNLKNPYSIGVRGGIYFNF